MIFKYAFKNISRSVGRNILIGLIVFVIATAACVALSVQQAADSARESSMEGMSVSGHIYVDRQYIMQNMSPGPDTDIRDVLSELSGLTLEEMETYAAAPSVQQFTYYAVISPDGADGLEAMSSNKVRTGSEESSEEAAEETAEAEGAETPEETAPPVGPNGETAPAPPSAPEMPQQPEDPEQMLQSMVYQGEFSLTGYYDETAMTDFQSGVCYITDGTMFEENTSERLCVIEQQLATLNDLSVGDEITLCNPNDETETYTLTICGIYKNTQISANTSVAANDPANTILTSYAVLDEIASASESASEYPMQRSLTGTYIFASVADYDRFEEEVRELGLSEKYTVTSTDIAAFEQSMLLLDNLRSFAETFLLITLLIGALVLIVISIINIRDRKYEIGAMAAMGMKKIKISGILVTEILIVTLAAILLGCAVGSAVSVPVTNTLLSAQVEQQKAEDEQNAANFGRASMNEDHVKPRGGDVEGEVEYVDSIEFSTNYEVILKMIGIGIALSLVSGMAAVLFILRYDPKQILANRD